MRLRFPLDRFGGKAREGQDRVPSGLGPPSSRRGNYLAAVILGQIGAQLGAAVALRADLDALMLLSSLHGMSCGACLRPYRYAGWLRRHYLRSRHCLGIRRPRQRLPRCPCPIQT